MVTYHVSITEANSINILEGEEIERTYKFGGHEEVKLILFNPDRRIERLEKVTENIRYDYKHQCWLIDGIVQRCGHEDNTCSCYGSIHEGEREV